MCDLGWFIILIINLDETVLVQLFSINIGLICWLNKIK